MRHLNYNHLFYFWNIVREGSVVSAAARLHLTPQTVSGQLRLKQPVRIHCREGSLAELAAKLAVHEIDVILSDCPLGAEVGVRAFSHALGETGASFFARPKLALALRRRFPHSLEGQPLLLPSQGSALRRSIDEWLDEERVQPRVVGEFDDSALLKAFGQAGVGVFCGPQAIEAEIKAQYRVGVVGRTPAISLRFFAISAERRLKHPAVVAIREHAKQELFSDA